MSDQKFLKTNHIHDSLIKWWGERRFKLTSIQKSVIESYGSKSKTRFLLADHVIIAPTGEGKTEAVFVPLLSAIADNDNSGPFDVLYISPLKTLINQQVLRIDEIASKIGKRAFKWHGEARKHKTEASRHTGGGILLITPESIEGMFGREGEPRRKMRLGKVAPINANDIDLLRCVKYIVIDEVHSFLGTERGKHLQSLMCRLQERFSAQKHVYVGISATLDPGAVYVKRYLRPKNPSSVKAIESFDHEAKDIIVNVKVFIDSLDDQDRGSKNKICKEVFNDFKRKSRWIVFADSRGVVEDYGKTIAALIKKEEFKLGLHHSSVLQKEREAVEVKMRSFDINNPVVREELKTYKLSESNIPQRMGVISTNTLELGIDIGKLESVGQIGPGYSVAALRQRLGRSSHDPTQDQPHEMSMYIGARIDDRAVHILDRIHPRVFQAVATVSLLKEGKYEKPDFERLHLSTLVHQFLSLIKQNGPTSATYAYEQLVMNGAWSDSGIEMKHFKSIVEYLTWKRREETGMPGIHHLEGTEFDFVMSPVKKDGDEHKENEGKTADEIKKEKKRNRTLAEKIVLPGIFVTAFQTIQDYLVFERGRQIGKLPSLVRYKVGETFFLNDIHYEVTNVVDSPKRLYVKIISTEAKVPKIGGEGQLVSDIIIERMKLLYEGNYPKLVRMTDAILNKEAEVCLRKGLEAYKNEVGKNRVVSDGFRGSVIFPWRGPKVTNTLMLALRMHGIMTVNSNFSLVAPNNSLDSVIAAIKRIKADNNLNYAELARLAASAQFEKFDWMLTPYFQRLNYTSAHICTKNELDAMLNELTGKSGTS